MAEQTPVRPLRVGVDASALASRRGPGRYLAGMVRALHQLDGLELVLFAPEPDWGPWQLPEALLTSAVVWASRRLPWLSWRMPVLARRHRVDVVWFPANEASPWGCRPYLLTLHDLAQAHFPDAFFASHREQRAYWRRLRGAAGRAARIVTDSGFSKGDICMQLGCIPERVDVVSIPPDPTFRPAPPPEVDAVRSQFSLIDPYILFVGGFDFRKNLRRLMAAFAQLVDEGFPHQLVLVGGRGNNPRLYPDPNEAVLAYQLGHRVSILDGGVDDGTLRALYTGADLFVFPSLFEGFGLPPLEAMACGTPVVCSRAASLPEVVGGAAVLFEPDEPGSIAAAMRGILCDPEAGGRLVDAGPAHAQSFSWDAAVRTLHAALMACC